MSLLKNTSLTFSVQTTERKRLFAEDFTDHGAATRPSVAVIKGRKKKNRTYIYKKKKVTSKLIVDRIILGGWLLALAGTRHT